MKGETERKRTRQLGEKSFQTFSFSQNELWISYFYEDKPKKLWCTKYLTNQSKRNSWTSISSFSSSSSFPPPPSSLTVQIQSRRSLVDFFLLLLFTLAVKWVEWLRIKTATLKTPPGMIRYREKKPLPSFRPFFFASKLSIYYTADSQERRATEREREEKQLEPFDKNKRPFT